MELKNFTVIDSSGEKAVVVAHDEKAAAAAWEYAHPGAKVAFVEEAG